MTLLFAVTVTLALTVVPGYLLARGLTPHLDPLVHVAISVPISAGVLYVSALWLDVLHLRVEWAAVAASLSAFAGLWFIIRAEGGTVLPWHAVSKWDLASAACAGMGLLAIWFTGMRSVGAVPPHDDGYHHGYWVARIVETGTIDPSVVSTIDPISSDRVVAFYPLASHVEAALVRLVTGADVPTAFNLVILLGTAISLPAGLLVLTRRLVPDARWAPAAAALFGASLPSLSYAASWSGLFPQMLGLAAVPGVSLVADDYVGRRSAKALVVAGLGLAGLVGLHTIAAWFCVLVVVALSMTDRPRLSWQTRIQDGLSWFVVAALFVLPTIMALSGGWRERRQNDHAAYMPVGESLASLTLLRDYVSGPAPLAFTVLAWLGVVISLRSRRMRAWTGLAGAFSALMVATTIWRTAPVLVLTSPWYSMPDRMSPYLTYLMVPFAASILAFRWRNDSPTGASSPLAKIVVGALTLAAVTGGLSSSIPTVRGNYVDYSLVSNADRRAFTWLAIHTEPGERVLNGRADESQWLYAIAGVVTTNWAKLQYPGPEAAERDWLTKNAALGWEDRRVAADLRRLNVRFAYVGDDFFPKTDNLLSGDQLAASPYWRVAYRSGKARVFVLLPQTASQAPS